MNIPDMHYIACWTEDDGIYSCDHEHASVAGAMRCLVPDGGGFIRAVDSWGFRSLTNGEFIDFLESLSEMPWSWRNKAQGGAIAVSANAVSAQ
jgi:hypothetical protein